MTNVRVEPVKYGSASFEDARMIRLRVFIEEQRVPVEEEWDEADATARHVVARHADGSPIGTGRLLVRKDDPEGTARIGRMAVLPEARGLGVGMAILLSLIEEARTAGFKRILLQSQTHAMDFYGRAGFTVCGPEYMESGIPHRDMELFLQENEPR